MPITEYMTGVNVEFNDMNQLFELFDSDPFLPTYSYQSNHFYSPIPFEYSLKESISSSNSNLTQQYYQDNVTESLVLESDETKLAPPQPLSPFHQENMNLIDQINTLIQVDRVAYSSRKQSTDIGLIHDEDLVEIKKLSNIHTKQVKSSLVPSKEEMYHLIDLELKDVPSSLGLVWSSFNLPNVTQPTNCAMNTTTTTPSTTRATSPIIALHTSSPSKITKKRKKSPATNKSTTQQPYRVRFGHNLFEEIVFKKSNPNQKFIIFK